MRRWILLALVLLLAAPAAWAIDTNKYPNTLMDQACTDSFNVPAAVTAGLTVIGGSPPIYAAGALVQISGTGDGFCDNDSRIITGNIVADTRFGPFTMKGSAYTCIFGLNDVDAMTGGSADYNLDVEVEYPFLAGTYREVDQSPDESGNNIDSWIISPGARDAGGTADVLNTFLGERFYLTINLKTATLMTASLGLVPGCAE